MVFNARIDRERFLQSDESLLDLWFEVRGLIAGLFFFYLGAGDLGLRNDFPLVFRVSSLWWKNLRRRALAAQQPPAV